MLLLIVGRAEACSLLTSLRRIGVGISGLALFLYRTPLQGTVGLRRLSSISFSYCRNGLGFIALSSSAMLMAV